MRAGATAEIRLSNQIVQLITFGNADQFQAIVPETAEQTITKEGLRMNRTTSGDAKGKAERQQTILRLIQEHPISRQEVLLEHLREEGFAVTQATISRDIRELCLVKAATSDGYRYVSSHNESLNPKMQGRFETIFHESVLGVDYAGHVVLVKCYSRHGKCCL